MPLYTFSCQDCEHTADKLIHLNERNEPIVCSKCKEEGREGTMIRVIALPSEPRFKGSDFTPKFH
jgi:putative FmdB family regulatory protein